MSLCARFREPVPLHVCRLGAIKSTHAAPAAVSRQRSGLHANCGERAYIALGANIHLLSVPALAPHADLPATSARAPRLSGQWHGRPPLPWLW